MDHMPISLIKICSSHDETPSTRGRGFSDIYKNEIGEMQRNMLAYVSKMQSNEKEGDGPHSCNGIKSPAFELTPAGFPVIPEGVPNNEIRKIDYEQLLRTFLGLHYSTCLKPSPSSCR